MSRRSRQSDRSRRPKTAQGRDFRLAGAVLLVAAVALALGVLAPRLRGQGPSAVIVDQLSLTQPNPDFAERATELLVGAGYTVDYVPGEDVSIDLYRSLPGRGYDLVVLRAHSARRTESGGIETDDIALFTSDPIDTTRFSIRGVPTAAATAVAGDLGADRAARAAAVALSRDEMAHVSPVFYDPDSGELPFFGVLPSFIRDHAEGTFEPSATVVLMGCDGLRSDAMARAFVDRGAERFVSWDQPVSARHTDAATLRLLELVLEGATVDEAVDQVTDELGPDPQYDGRLALYPR